MDDFRNAFEERLQEIEVYLDLLDSLEREVQGGSPRLGQNGTIITMQQQKILYSCVYLQLYNLVESTVTRCLDAVSTTIVYHRHQPKDLSNSFRGEWVRFIARTHTDLTPDNRLQYALELCDHLVDARPITPSFKIEKGGGGNWADEEIYDLICRRLCLPWRVDSDVQSAIKRPFRDGKGALASIKNIRNELAHGSRSFSECGENVTVSDLRHLTRWTADYLRAIVDCFKTSIDNREYLLPDRR
ncbi:MAE_28990/MAE_18760 family HEPN-like nuclease [Pannus brasiliensis CCIBt3594]|uniref:MAE_28990/MAE_18760 family HEPN-like nuclease n=1 Tax=Pannus brasiliensis CCIBt3594 TaxID=1427578 RepID=A0AAW9QUV7_9CHRO